MLVVSLMLFAGDMSARMHWIGNLMVVKVGLEMVAKRKVPAGNCKSPFG